MQLRWPKNMFRVNDVFHGQLQFARLCPLYLDLLNKTIML